MRDLELIKRGFTDEYWERYVMGQLLTFDARINYVGGIGDDFGYFPKMDAMIEEWDGSILDLELWYKLCGITGWDMESTIMFYFKTVRVSTDSNDDLMRKRLERAIRQFDIVLKNM